MVHINGKDIDAAGQSLAAYLKANDYEMGTFVVECNEEIIHKEDYENYMLKDGDIIEIVQFMGGGCGTSLMYCMKYRLVGISDCASPTYI